jgi:hypothetical protein
MSISTYQINYWSDFLHSSDTGEKMGVQWDFIDFKKAYDSVRREVLYNILIEFGVTMQLVRLIKLCWNEIYSKVRIGKHLSDSFPIQNGLKTNWMGMGSQDDGENCIMKSFMMCALHQILLEEWRRGGDGQGI